LTESCANASIFDTIFHVTEISLLVLLFHLINRQNFTNCFCWHDVYTCVIYAGH